MGSLDGIALSSFKDKTVTLSRVGARIASSWTDLSCLDDGTALSSCRRLAGARDSMRGELGAGEAGCEMEWVGSGMISKILMGGGVSLTEVREIET